MIFLSCKLNTHVTHKVEVHDDGPPPEAGVVLPGRAGNPLLLAGQGEIRELIIL